MRMIDRVTVKGSIEPLDLYTCDVEYNNLPMDPYECKKTRRELKLLRVRSRMARDKLRQLAYDGQI